MNTDPNSPELIGLWEAFCIWLRIDESDPISLLGARPFDTLKKTCDPAAPLFLWGGGLLGAGITLAVFAVLLAVSSNAVMALAAALAAVLLGVGKNLLHRGRNPSRTHLLARAVSDKHRAIVRKLVVFGGLIADENWDIRDATGERVDSELFRTSAGWALIALSYAPEEIRSAFGWSLPLRLRRSLVLAPKLPEAGGPAITPEAEPALSTDGHDACDANPAASAEDSIEPLSVPRKRLHWLHGISPRKTAALIGKFEKLGVLTPQEETWFKHFMLAARDVAQDGPITITSLATKAAKRCRDDKGVYPPSMKTAEDWLGFRTEGRYAKFYLFVMRSLEQGERRKLQKQLGFPLRFPK